MPAWSNARSTGTRKRARASSSRSAESAPAPRTPAQPPRPSLRELPAELVEVCAPAEHDDAVAAGEGLVSRRGELEPAVGALHGDHDHAGAPADVGVAERLALERRS